MSEQLPLYEPDEATLDRDDALLDALGSGVKLPGEDTLAMALFMWREDLSAPPKATAAQRARRKRRRITWGIIAAGLAAALGTGATVAAASNARPGNPLFPITEFVFPQQASTASAEVAKERIADAQTAVDEQHLPEAEKLLDEAEALIAKVTSVLEKDALLADLQRVRALLNAALSGTPLPTPAPTPAPTGVSAPGPGGTSAPGATPSPGKSGGLPLPLPTISVPPLLPSLPLG
ncbi:MAG TPA: hypothetical protein VFC19_38910 [Candidatus Limnocylindrales bacterium]|nr:hypothetical protein [Candidatus Limnocylindrales bacterium]